MDRTLERALGLLRAATVVPHTDADGLAAGAIALRATRRSVADAVLFGRGDTPFDPGVLPERAVALLDWGIRRLDRPALFVDHHAPEAEPGPGAVVLSGYGLTPAVSTSVLMRRIAPEEPAWLAAVGAYGDLGAAGLRLPECAGAPRAAVRRLTALVNAPRRVPGGPVREALVLLVESPTAEDALRDPRSEVLVRCNDEWRGALKEAMRTAPVVRNGAALIRLRSPYQIHPVVATAWERRLAPRVVVAANEGYVDGRVNFAVRGGNGDLREALKAALPDATGEYAHGHDRATGGSVDPETFERVLVGLGLR
jgi:single-stranded-DNA-specific exonuclease